MCLVNLQSHAKAEAAIVEAVKPLSTLNVCDPIRVQASATAVARALAQVYVEAFSKVMRTHMLT